MNEKEHAKGEHAKSEVFHLHRSRRYADRSDALAKLAKHFRAKGDDEIADGFNELSAIDKSMSSVEGERADHHRQMGTLVDSMETSQPYGKSAGGYGLVPDQVRGVTILNPHRVVT